MPEDVRTSLFMSAFIDINYFKVGDEVRHLFGSKFLEKVSKFADNEVICLVCGVMSRMGNDFCFNCRHTLVKRSSKYTNQ